MLQRILMVTWPQGSKATKRCLKRGSSWSPGHKAALDKSLTWFHSWSRPPMPAFASQAAAAPENFFFLKSLLKYWDLPPENFLFKQGFWKIEVGHLRTGEGRETPLQSARGVERVPWGKVKLTMSRSFLFFGQDLFFFRIFWLQSTCMSTTLT